MAYQDLRSFLETLEKEGQLIRIKDEVMPEPEEDEDEDEEW